MQLEIALPMFYLSKKKIDKLQSFNPKSKTDLAALICSIHRNCQSSAGRTWNGLGTLGHFKSTFQIGATQPVNCAERSAPKCNPPLLLCHQSRFMGRTASLK